MAGGSSASVAVIPARGGSKRLPRKNIRELDGEPLISWTIRACLDSGVFDRVVVTTDDDEIAAAARAAGAEVPFVRDPELSDDTTALLPVIKDAAIRLGIGPTDETVVCCVYATAVGLRATDLSAGRQLLAAQPSDWDGYVIGVARYAHPVQRALSRSESGTLAMVDPSTVAMRTQDLEPRWFDAGQFTWGRARTWYEQLPILTHALGLELPEWRVVDLDTEDDWQRAQILHPILRSNVLG